jgi:hypothetical protein
MFKKDKHRAADPASTNHNGSLTSSSERIDNVTSTTSSNFGGVNRDPTSVSSRSATPTRGTRPPPPSSDTSDPFAFWDTSAIDATTPANPPSSTSSSSTRHPKSIVSGSTLPSPALQSAYQRGADSATTAADQIAADQAEVVNIIANYAVEPSEMLHLGRLNVV